MGMEITSYLCMLGAAPCAALGFIKYQGMSAEQIVITAWRSFLLSKQCLIFEPVNLYYEILKRTIEKHKQEALGKHDKKLFKIKKAK